MSNPEPNNIEFIQCPEADDYLLYEFEFEAYLASLRDEEDENEIDE